MTIREIIKRDIGVKVEGVVKVYDDAALATEMREFVVTDKIEDELKRIVDTFTQVSETLRLGGTSRDVMGIWISGFFGSGKSHFSKVLGYLLQNDEIGDTSGEKCIDLFSKHISDTARGKNIRARLGEIKQNTQIKTIAFEIRSRQSLTNPNSVGEIILGEFYRSIGLSENFVVARIERKMAQKGLLETLEKVYESKHGVPWKSAEGRDDLMSVRRRLAEIMPDVDPVEYKDRNDAKKAIDDMFRHAKLTAESLADELVSWVDAQKTTGGKVQHLIFVIDEMGTFIGDSNEKISELNSIAEMIGNKGKGKVWLFVTSQQDLEKVVDRTNFQPALIGRLNARFELKPHLISDEINKVVSERILKKYPAQEPQLKKLYLDNEGYISQLADLKASRFLGTVDERAFIDCYPLLPHQIRLSQDIFEALSGFRLSGGVRSMISVVMTSLQEIADSEVGAVVSFDMIFDAVENDLLSQEYLGAAGVRSIRESDERVTGTPIDPAKVLKVLWLLQRVPWVPRISETIAKLLVTDFKTDIPQLRENVEKTLGKLQEAGYVARDEATGEWKYLDEQERTIEQYIQEMVRSGGSKSISIAAVRRTSQEITKMELTTKKKLLNFTVPYGITKVPFSYGVYLDGEAIETGSEIEVCFVSPLMSGRKQEIEEIKRRNQADSAKGRKVWWVADVPDNLELRFKRYEALVKVCGDKRFTEDTSKSTQDALAEKRKERDDLKTSLVKDLEQAFLKGTVYYGGLENELERATDFKEPVQTALTSVIPNVYPRFSIADKSYDFDKSIKAILNPATTALDKVAPDLGLFDSQGNLQQQSDLVAQVLEVLKDLEDEDIDPTGVALMDANDRKGFKGFSRAPFGWPDEILRIVLAACFRAGAVYMEQQSPGGPTPVYDYKGTNDNFQKINTFKKVTFRLAEISLSVEQIKLASKELIALGMNGIPESGNAIASAVRKLGEKLKSDLQDAKSRAEMGIPISDIVLDAGAALDEPVTIKDPTKAVTAFLSRAAEWKSFQKAMSAIRAFLDDNRHQAYFASRKLANLAANHPIPADNPESTRLGQALKDMDAIIGDKSVVDRWPDYRAAYETALGAYRGAYKDAYKKVQTEIENLINTIKGGSAYKNAPAESRDAVLEKVFGPGGPCNYPEIPLSSAETLLAAAAKSSLTSLAQTLMALPGYRGQVETELIGLAAPTKTGEAEKVCDWQPSQELAGKRLKTEADVDQTLSVIGEQLKTRIRKGFTVVIK